MKIMTARPTKAMERFGVDPLPWMTVMVMCVLSLVVGVGDGRAVYGEDYDVMPINSGVGTVDVPALADRDAQGGFVYDRFFWAGTCDRGAARVLAPGDVIPGGFGLMPSSVSAIGVPARQVAPPSTPKHCIDWQINNQLAPSPTTMWNTPPAWRLGAATQAGSHVDGSTTFAFDGVSATGYTDNVVVELPPGFVADPNAVAKCSAEQFDALPYQCPPESQVGVLNLRLNGTGLGSNGEGVDAHSSPVYNLEPREGNVAELGLVSLASFSTVTNRIVAKARTNGDYGVTAFVGQVPNPLPIHEQAITIWGVPWAAHNDVWRAPLGHAYYQGSSALQCMAQPGSNVNDVLPSSGLPVNEVQTVTVDADGGTFTLGFDGEVTAGIAFDADAATVEAALEALGNVDVGDVSVFGGLGGPWRITFSGAYAFENVTELVADGTGLVGADAAVGVVTTVQGGACPVQRYSPSWGKIKPFVSLESECNQAPVTTLLTDAYQFPGSYIPDGRSPGEKLGLRNADPDPSDPNWKIARSPAPPVTGCEKLPFSPDIEFAPGSSTAGAPTGLSVDLSIPQNGELPFDPPAPGADRVEVDQYVEAATDHWGSDAGLATAHLKDTVVALPAGFSVNPSGATGLEGCSDSQIGITGRQGVRYLFNNGDPFNKDGGADGSECPDGSKIGTARVKTPLLDQPLLGEVVLGAPASTDPRSNEMLRLFVVVRDPDRGVIAKVFGSSTVDGQIGSGGTGQIAARFVENPEVPFDDLQLDFKGGPRGMLAMPQTCGSPGWSAAFTPWSSVGASVPVADVPDSGQFPVDAGCGQRFVPELEAGTDNAQGGGSGAFSFRFWREDGEAWLAGLSAKLPKGFLASVRDVTLCTNAQANAGACPADSRIGIADAKAGAGDPFVLEEKGEVFLTEGYKGGPYGLAVKVRGIAGPFRGAMELSPIIVRQKIDVDPTTAQVTVISDPFPLVHHGVPLRVREVNVIVNRQAFTHNPTSCAAKQIRASFTAADGASYERTVPFQATNCAKLAFKPKLTMRLTGKRQMTTGKHPGIKATVTQKPGEAGIRRVVVRLPLSLALDPDNAQALCEFTDGTKPDLENHCPKGSIIGRAKAISPLLKKPLAGNVYFVKNVRTDPQTGNQIRTLPMLIIALRGEIAVNLRGNSNVKNRKLVSTFATVPDAPVSRFNLNINGGKNGVLAITRTTRNKLNLCNTNKPQTAEADIDAHNNKHHDRAITLNTPCNSKTASGNKKNRRKPTQRG